MQELDQDHEFFDWLRGISNRYEQAMTSWGQAVHDSVSGSDGSRSIATLLAATDTTIDRLIDALIEIGRRHDLPRAPHGADEVLVALEQLLGTSAELLRTTRPGIASEGMAALSALAPRIAELRALEAEVEASTERMWGELTDKYGDPGRPEEPTP